MYRSYTEENERNALHTIPQSHGPSAPATTRGYYFFSPTLVYPFPPLCTRIPLPAVRNHSLILISIYNKSFSLSDTYILLLPWERESFPISIYLYITGILLCIHHFLIKHTKCLLCLFISLSCFLFPLDFKPFRYSNSLYVFIVIISLIYFFQNQFSIQLGMLTNLCNTYINKQYQQLPKNFVRVYMYVYVLCVCL